MGEGSTLTSIRKYGNVTASSTGVALLSATHAAKDRRSSLANKWQDKVDIKYEEKNMEVFIQHFAHFD